MSDPASGGILRVAVGVLQRASGEVLIAERASERHAGGGYEFPGGKCDPGESGLQALRRELGEELGINAREAQPLIRVRHAYDERTVELDTYRVTGWAGEPHGAEGQPVRWMHVHALRAADFPEANRPILAALACPARCLVTPDLELVADGERLLAGIEAALGGGAADAVQLRRSDRGSEGWWALVEAVAAACRRHSAALVVNADPEHAPHLPDGAGLHLRERALRGLGARPVAAGVRCSGSVHDASGLERATRLGLDAAFLGPVLPTQSHPGSASLGWAGLGRLAATTPLPLYALGGVGPADLHSARGAGAVGVAGIRGFWSGG